MKLKVWLNRNSGNILTATSIFGLLTTTWFAATETPGYLEDREKHSTEDLGTKERIVEESKIFLKHYWPALVSGGSTALAIISIGTVHASKTAAVQALLDMSTIGYQRYREHVFRRVGRIASEEIDASVADEDLQKAKPDASVLLVSGGTQSPVYDSLSGRYFLSTIEDIKSLVNEFNRKLMSEQTIPLNDWFDDLGLEMVEMGNHVGWDVSRGFLEISFLARLNKLGQPCIVIQYRNPPYPI